MGDEHSIMGGEIGILCVALAKDVSWHLEPMLKFYPTPSEYAVSTGSEVINQLWKFAVNLGTFKLLSKSWNFNGVK